MTVDAARSLASDGYNPDAISRAYYAAFYAAEACLLALGETRSKHSGVLSAFGELVVHGGGLPPGDGKLLNSLFARRNEADYRVDPIPGERALAAVHDAERFVAAVERWLRERSEDARP